MTDSEDVADLLEHAATGDAAAVTELLARYRKRLKRMVHLRMSRHLQKSGERTLPRMSAFTLN